MPKPRPHDDLAKELNQVADTAVALQKALLRTLDTERLKLELELHRAEIEKLKNNIQALVAMAQANRKEPDLAEHRRQLLDAEVKFEQIKAELHARGITFKRWWQFWK